MCSYYTILSIILIYYKKGELAIKMNTKILAFISAISAVLATGLLLVMPSISETALADGQHCTTTGTCSGGSGSGGGGAGGGKGERQTDSSLDTFTITGGGGGGGGGTGGGGGGNTLCTLSACTTNGGGSP
jgi:hypothetical protein